MNSDDGYHAAHPLRFSSVGKEKILAASSAVAGIGDVLRDKARILKLAPRDSDQVEAPFGLAWRMEGGEGIDGFSGAGNEIPLLGKLRVESIEDLLSDFVTTRLDAGAEDRDHFRRG